MDKEAENILVGEGKDDAIKSNAVIINELQLILAEKRTALGLMRTGIAVLALPLSVMSFLIATSRYYNIIKVLYIFVPLALFSFLLIIFGVYLIIKSIYQLRHYDRLIYNLKMKHSIIRELIE